MQNEMSSLVAALRPAARTGTWLWAAAFSTAALPWQPLPWAAACRWSLQGGGLVQRRQGMRRSMRTAPSGCCSGAACRQCRWAHPADSRAFYCMHQHRLSLVKRPDTQQPPCRITGRNAANNSLVPPHSLTQQARNGRHQRLEQSQVHIQPAGWHSRAHQVGMLHSHTSGAAGARAHARAG